MFAKNTAVYAKETGHHQPHSHVQLVRVREVGRVGLEPLAAVRLDLGGRPARRCDRRSGSSVHPVLEVLELAVRQHGGDDVASRGRRLGEAAVEEHVGVAGRAICGLGVEDLGDGPGGGGDGADDAVVGGVRVVGGAEEARKLCVGGLE